LNGQNAPGPAALVLTATVARRYYLDGATKTDIAAELGLSRFKVAHLLEEARASGIVRIEFDSSGQIDLDLSVRLSDAFGLRHCVVTDTVRAVARRLRDRISGADDGQTKAPCCLRLTHIEGEERDGRTADALGGGEMERVKRSYSGHLCDPRGCVARELVELDDREDAEVLGKCRAGGGGVVVDEQACEVAADLDDRVPSRQQ
jgi:hypothetical protein